MEADALAQALQAAPPPAAVMDPATAASLQYAGYPAAVVAQLQQQQYLQQLGYAQAAHAAQAAQAAQAGLPVAAGYPQQLQLMHGHLVAPEQLAAAGMPGMIGVPHGMPVQHAALMPGYQMPQLAPPKPVVLPSLDNEKLTNKIFVGGLPAQTTVESMKAYFSNFGPCECVVMMDKITGKSRGFGFCMFQTREQALSALQAGTNISETQCDHILDGKVVSARICEEREGGKGGGKGFGGPPLAAGPPGGCMDNQGGPIDGAGVEQLASALKMLEQTLGNLVANGGCGGMGQPPMQQQPPPQQQLALPAPSSAPPFQPAQSQQLATPSSGLPAARIFVGGLPQTCDDLKLNAFCSQFGPVLDAKVMIDRHTQRSRGFGYVSFAEPEAIELALANAHANVIDDKWIEIKRCEDKGSPMLQGNEQPPFNADGREFGAGGGGNPPPFVVRGSGGVGGLQQVPGDGQQVGTLESGIESVLNIALSALTELSNQTQNQSQSPQGPIRPMLPQQAPLQQPQQQQQPFGMGGDPGGDPLGQLLQDPSALLGALQQLVNSGPGGGDVPRPSSAFGSHRSAPY